jgi:hypothetical protein
VPGFGDKTVREILDALAAVGLADHDRVTN